MIKKFSKELYDQYDSIGKNALAKFLETKGFIITENPFGKYGIDLKATKGKSIFYLDAEIRRKWTEKDFPYPVVNVLERKKKFADIPKSYIVFISNDLTQFAFVSGSVIRKEYLKSNPNEFVANGENAYKIPLWEVHFDSL